MLEKIKHNLGIKIIAVLVAVFLWFVVYINDNPIETRNLVIPISVLNEDSLLAGNLEVLNEYNTEIEIYVRGRKADVDSVTESDFIAYVDFSEITDETTEYVNIRDLRYLGDRNISVGFANSGRIGVSVDRIVTGEVPITVVLNGKPAEGFAVVGTILKPTNYIAIDIKSLVQNVDSAVVEIDVNELRGTKTIRKLCMVYDEFGNIINELSNKTAVEVTVSIAKSIPVDIVTAGIPEQDHLMTNAEADPAEVLITGSEEDLAKINSISTLPVNLGGATETFMVSAGLVSPPSGTAFVGTGNTDVSVSIETLFEKTFDIAAEDISIRWGTPSIKLYEIIENAYTIIVKGRQSVLDNTDITGLTPYIDVSTAEDGQSSLPLRFQSLGSLEQISYPLVDVYIESKAVFEVETRLITINGMDVEKYNYVFSDDIELLNVRGMSEVINNVDLLNLRMSADASDLAAGTHEVYISLSLPDGVNLISELRATLVISDKANE